MWQARRSGNAPVSYTHLDVYKRQAQVDTGADDRVGYHVVFVHTCAYEYAHPLGFPLVLQVCADDIDVYKRQTSGRAYGDGCEGIQRTYAGVPVLG